MGNDVLSLSEKQVQELIADYPWLLNIDYEIVSGLKNKGMEYILSDNKRADLILRDRMTGRPIIIEFKAVPFYRENIGQILEYKARIISESTNENSVLKDIFADKIYSPIMILVVPNCSAEARLACNLSGIEIYEYNKIVKEILIPEKKRNLEDFKKDFDIKDIPFNIDRDELVKRVYNDIKEVLCKENLLDGWIEYKKPSGEYFPTLNHLFVNKWLFSNNAVSIGICESIFDEEHTNFVAIEYYSANEKLLIKFIEKYRELNLMPQNNDDNIKSESYEEFYWTFLVDKKEFFNNTKEMIKTYIKNYENIMKNHLKLYE
ncbi:hypothetical protein [Clostridium sp. C2-6-12]|uniref:hypothetical protein n=1 Tax=Clostridium sp. C2-6-12 TaxID=2698832 RepID=UPI001368D9FD|nr:hypothetical protein [Clostridium sp. C2-6-12]